MIKVTAVFDIGKTNKKFFLFDENHKVVYKEYTRFEEIEDEDGHPTENIHALTEWVQKVFNRVLKSNDYEVEALNFSTYGASLVHLDENGVPVTPLYNYTKEINSVELEASLFEKYGPKEDFLKSTGCSDLSMLNSGFQLYWIKHTKPEVFKNIKYSLHLPQYLSYIFTGQAYSDYTSIGCHTALWDYSKKDYHDWVYKEKIDRVLAPIVSTETSVETEFRGKLIKFGVGIHDSSSALVPYVKTIRNKFILISTGTWSITLNPFTKNPISADGSTINYMRINGNPVKASSLFLGNEYKIQVNKLNTLFGVSSYHHQNVVFDLGIFKEISKDFKHCFKWESLESPDMPKKTRLSNQYFEYAYHQLMLELVLLQIKCLKDVLAEDDDISRIYVDGGFSDNDIYINLISHFFRDKKLWTTDSSLGSALGAAIVISKSTLDSKFLNRNYALKKHVPFQIS